MVDMLQAGIEVEKRVFTTMMSLYAEHNNLEAAFKIWENMKTRNIVDTRAGNMLLRLASSGDNPLLALTVYEKEFKEQLTEDLFTYSILILSCVKGSNYNLGNKYMQSIFIIYKLTVGYIKQIDTLGIDSVMANTMLRCATHLNMTKVNQVLRLMKKNKLNLGIYFNTTNK